MKKRMISLVMAMVMVCSFATTAFAADITSAGGNGTTPVVLNVEPAIFSVTVPTSLPVTMTAQGDIQVATEAKIINNSAGAVRVENVAITPAGDWTLIAFDTDPASLLVDEHKLGLLLNGSKTGENGQYAFVADDWDVMQATDGADGGDDEFVFTYDAILPIQTVDFADETIANVVFTVDWND